MARKRLTYANVMSTIAVFLVLGGAGAFAASQLAKRSVGAQQLKANAVTAAKIRRNAVGAAKLKSNAVTVAKIKDGAVDSAKIADGTVGAADIDAGVPYARVVARMRATSSLAVSSSLQPYPLSTNTYTQAADEVDTYAGAVDVSFPAACLEPRRADAIVLVDPVDPAKPTIGDYVGLGQTEDAGSGAVSKRIEIGPFPGIGGRFEPGAPKPRTVFLVIEGSCKAGSGITATAGGVDVIGTR